MIREDWELAYTSAKIEKLCAVLVADPETQGAALVEELLAAGRTFLGATASGLYVKARPGPVRDSFSAALRAVKKLCAELEKIHAHGPSFFHLVQTADRTEPRQLAGYTRAKVTTPKDPSNSAGERSVREELVPYYTTSPGRLGHDLPLLEQTLSTGLAELEPDSGGPTPNLELRVYIHFLVRIYEKFAGLPARKNLTTDPKTGTFSGPFYDFVKLNFDIVKPGHGKTNLALARQIRTVLDEPPLLADSD